MLYINKIPCFSNGDYTDLMILSCSFFEKELFIPVNTWAIQKVPSSVKLCNYSFIQSTCQVLNSAHNIENANILLRWFSILESHKSKKGRQTNFVMHFDKRQGNKQVKCMKEKQWLIYIFPPRECSVKSIFQSSRTLFCRINGIFPSKYEWKWQTK